MSHGSESIRVLIAGPPSLFWRGLRAGLGSIDDIEVVGESADGPTLIKLMQRLGPHVLLTDAESVTCKGFEDVFRVSTARVVVTLATLDEGRIVNALRAGATGILLRTASPAELVQCIRIVHSGKYAIGSEAIAALVKVVRQAAPTISNGATPGAYALTPRELGIIEKITAGLSNREVCEEFSISERTVKHHLTRIYSKIGVTNRLALALFAVNHRLIDTQRNAQHPLTQVREPNGFANGAAHD